MNINRLKFLSFFTLIILGLSLGACQNNQEEQANEETVLLSKNHDEGVIEISKEQFDFLNMTLDTLSTCQFNESINASGVLEVPPTYHVSISLMYGGYIDYFDLLPGQKVKKGAHILSVRNPEFIEIQQSYLAVTQELIFLKDNFERMQKLASENISAQKDYVKAESDYKKALANQNGLRQKLKMLNIPIKKVENSEIQSTVNVYAPISGYVSAVNIHKGMYLSPTDIALEITNTSHLHLELKVFEGQVHLLKEGQKINFTLQGDPSKYEAEVHLIGKEIEGSERYVRVHGHLLSKPSSHFVPGMYAQAEILVESTSTSCVPEEAVVQMGDDHYVLWLKESTKDKLLFEPQKIKKKSESKGSVAIDVLEKTMAKQYLSKGAFHLIADGTEGHDH